MSAAELTAASAAIDERILQTSYIGGGWRASVYRCILEGGGSVVAKVYKSSPDALRSFTCESAALAMPARSPELYGVDVEYPLIVMEDIGEGPTLGDILCRVADPGRVSDVLVKWAASHADVAVAGASLRSKFDDLLDRYDRGEGDWNGLRWLSPYISEFGSVVSDFGVNIEGSTANSELEKLQAFVLNDPFPVFSAGDICPDNAVWSGKGFRVLDFEQGSFHSVFSDAANFSMPFATCWCVYRIPHDVQIRMEESYRERLSSLYPELRDGDVWRDGRTDAVAMWTIALTAMMLPAASLEDSAMRQGEPCSPGTRKVLRHRWQHFVAVPRITEVYPALVDVLLGLLQASELEWKVSDLPRYRAFESGL